MQQYFLTYGRGMNKIVLKELNSLPTKSEELRIESSEIEGKLVFSTNMSVSCLLSLKTVERIFASIIFKTLSNEVQSSQKELLAYIEHNFKFDFQMFFGSSDKFKDESESKRHCKGFKFRVDCRMRGKWKKEAEFKQNLIQNINEYVKTNNPLMEVDLKSPDFSVTCHLSDTCLAIGVGLAQQPLSVRSYLKHVGLRSTICCALLQEVDHFDSAALVLDPFCGRSTITAEMFNSRSWSSQFWICSDANQEQLDRSRENLSGFEHRHGLVQANLCRRAMLPYKSAIADAIISDLPFGKNYSIEFFPDCHVKEFYETTLAEFERILAKPGTIVLLVNSNEFEMIKECLNRIKTGLKLISSNNVSLGETSATIVKLINF